MGRSHRLVKLLCAVALAAGGALWLAVSTVAAGEDSITGVVRSASGAEAGVYSDEESVSDFADANHALTGARAVGLPR